MRNDGRYALSVKNMNRRYEKRCDPYKVNRNLLKNSIDTILVFIFLRSYEFNFNIRKFIGSETTRTSVTF